MGWTDGSRTGLSGHLRRLAVAFTAVLAGLVLAVVAFGDVRDQQGSAGLDGIAGQPVSGTLATFVTCNSPLSDPGFTATAVWTSGAAPEPVDLAREPDGNSRACSGPQYKYTVSGSHVYAAPGTYTITVTIREGFSSVTSAPPPPRTVTTTARITAPGTTTTGTTTTGTTTPSTTTTTPSTTTTTPSTTTTTPTTTTAPSTVTGPTTVPGLAPKPPVGVIAIDGLDAGQDVVTPGALLTANSDGSTDDKNIVNREWSVDLDETVEVPHERRAATGFTPIGRFSFAVPKPNDEGTHTLVLRLRLTDDDGLSSVTERRLRYRLNKPPFVDFVIYQGKRQVASKSLPTGGVVTAGQPFSIDARGSSNDVVRYEWSFDAAKPLTEREFAFDTSYLAFEVGPHKVSVRVTDGDGATDTFTLTLTAIEAACDPAVKQFTVKRLVVQAGCFAKVSTTLANGTISTRYTTRSPVRVNGIDVTPLGGKTFDVTVRNKPGKAPDYALLESGSAKIVALAPDKTPLVVHADGLLSLTLVSDGKELTFLEAQPGKSTIGGIKVTSLGSQIVLTAGGGARLTARSELPAQFGSRAPDKELTVETAGTVDKTLRAATLRDIPAFQFEVNDVPLDPLYIDKLLIRYEGNGTWFFDGRGTLSKPMPIGICGQVSIENGRFKSAHLEATFVKNQKTCKNDAAGTQGLQVGLFFIKTIIGDVEFPDPGDKVTCIKAGKEKLSFQQVRDTYGLTYAQAPDVEYDYGTPISAFCARVNFGFGPTVLGERLAVGSFKGGFAHYAPDKPDVFFANGSVDILGKLLTGRGKKDDFGNDKDVTADLQVWTNGYVKVAVDGFLNFRDIVTLDGKILFEALFGNNTKFDAYGRVEACVRTPDLGCAGAEGRVSTKGVGACLFGRAFGFKVAFGATYAWKDTFPTPYLLGCDLEKIREEIEPGATGPTITPLPEGSVRSTRAVRAGVPANVQTFEVAAGRAGMLVGVEGQDALPKVTLIEPGGRQIVYDGRDRENLDEHPEGRYAFMDAPDAHVVNVMIGAPRAGMWQVRVDPGSTPVTGLVVGEAKPPAKLKATVLPRGGQFTLRYDREVRPGELVRFVEEGPSISGEIGTAKGAKGELLFTPAPGSRERRSIAAIVTHANGNPGPKTVVATYSAPGAPPVGAVKGLKTKRAGTRIVASWKRLPTAARYEVAFKLADKRTRFVVTKTTRTIMSGVLAKTAGSVTVRPLGKSGVRGTKRTARFAAKRAKALPTCSPKVKRGCVRRPARKARR